MELGGGFVLCVVLLAAVVGRATAATYVVGDNLGWNVPSSVNEYSSWASRHVFRPGDVLSNLSLSISVIYGVTNFSIFYFLLTNFFKSVQNYKLNNLKHI